MREQRKGRPRTRETTTSACAPSAIKLRSWRQRALRSASGSAALRSERTELASALVSVRQEQTRLSEHACRTEDECARLKEREEQVAAEQTSLQAQVEDAAATATAAAEEHTSTLTDTEARLRQEQVRSAAKVEMVDLGLMIAGKTRGVWELHARHKRHLEAPSK